MSKLEVGKSFVEVSVFNALLGGHAVTRVVSKEIGHAIDKRDGNGIREERGEVDGRFLLNQHVRSWRKYSPLGKQSRQL